MRHGTFFATLALLACMMGFLGHVPATFLEPMQPVLAVPTTERCLALSYEPPPQGNWMPATIRLTTIPAQPFDRAWARGYRAVGGPGTAAYLFAGWRAAGADSIDIGWHHSPIMRLPSRRGAPGETLLGRGGWWSYPTFYSAVFGEGDFAVRAVEISCPPSK